MNETILYSFNLYITVFNIEEDNQLNELQHMSKEKCKVEIL